MARSPLTLAGRTRLPVPAGVSGPIRTVVDAAGLRRIGAGDVVVVDAPDLPAGLARELAAAGPAAVVDTASSCTGRRPVTGAGILLDAGIALVDVDRSDAGLGVRAGATVRIDPAGVVRDRDGRPLAHGRLHDEESIAAAAGAAQTRVGTALGAFAAAAADRLRRHPDLLDAPFAPTALGSGRPVLLLDAGPSLPDDLRRLRRWQRSAGPVVVATAAAARAAGRSAGRVHVLVADPADRDDIPRRTTVVVTEPGDGGPAARALVLATSGPAPYVVVAGGPQDAYDTLDSGGVDVALLRLHHASRVVPARAAAALHRPRATAVTVVLVAVVVAVALAVAFAAVPADRLSPALLDSRWQRLLHELGAGVVRLWHRL